MKALWIAAAAVVGIASSAWGTTGVPVTFDASLTGKGRMEVRLTSNSEFVTRGNLEVQQGDDIQNIPLTLVPGAAIPVSVHVKPGVEDVVVRYFMESGTAAAVDVLHLGSDPAGAHRVASPSEREQGRAAQAEQSERAQAAERARKHIKALLAAGRKPGLDPEEDSVVAQEWNKAVRELAPKSRRQLTTHADGPCGSYVLSPYNYSYPLRGNFGYVDEYPYSHNVRPWMPGYPVRVVVLQDLEDPCGNAIVRERYYNTTSSNNGAIYIASITSLEYYGDNPVHRLEVTTQYVGLRSGTTMSAYTHTLNSSQVNFFWNGSEACIDPYFSTFNSSYPFFFRWEDEIRYQKNQWNSYGFNSYFTPFRAGYEGTGSNGARFYPVSPGMVIFDSAGRWSSGFVMAHEIGHHFQFRLQGDRWSGAGPVHSICQILADPDGFNEGFADWYGAFWNSQGADAQGVNCFSGECYALCSPSYRKEGNVMQYFWDIFDATNHSTRDQGQDTIFRPLTILQNWRATGAYSSFPDWYNDFYSKGVWSGYESVVNTLRTVNGVDVP